MIKNPYFVILWHPNDFPLPMVNMEGDLATFPDLVSATSAAESNPIGQACGYGIFNLKESIA